jgi:hypothetical protein
MENEAKTDLPLESDLEASMEGNSVKEIPNPPNQAPDFPEGGLRGWSVAIGCSGVLFSTFGYVNAFGYALYLHLVSLYLTEFSVMQEYYQTHMLRHETPSAISWIGSLQTFFLFAGSLVGGPLFDRFGAQVCSHIRT